jgi:hypothetical protein
LINRINDIDTDLNIADLRFAKTVYNSDDPAPTEFFIRTTDQMENIHSSDWTFFTQDLNLTFERKDLPIVIDDFHGTFNGNGNIITITNELDDNNEETAYLFDVNKGTLKNVNLEGKNVFIAEENDDDGKILCCKVNGELVGDECDDCIICAPPKKCNDSDCDCVCDYPCDDCECTE